MTFHFPYVGDDFVGGESALHFWNAVFISGTWRLLDCCFGAGRIAPKTAIELDNGEIVIDEDDNNDVVEVDGDFIKELDEHFFLTDPDEFVYTHFPFSESGEPFYERWQLISRPITLDAFNALPHLTPMFFEYALRLGNEIPTPIVIATSITDEAEVPLEIHLWAWEVVRYKYKLYPADEHWSNDVNQYGFCYLKGRQRKMCVMRVNPPEVGSFYLKLFAKPEEEIVDAEDTLDHVATFLLHVTKVAVPPMPWPLSDLPWGITEAFKDTDAILVGLVDPIIRIVGDKKKRIILKTPNESILSLCHIYDYAGNELIIDKDKEMKYTVLLSKKNLKQTMPDAGEEVKQ